MKVKNRIVSKPFILYHRYKDLPNQWDLQKFEISAHPGVRKAWPAHLIYIIYF